MDINYLTLLPEIILSVVGILLVVVIPLTPTNHQNRLGLIALAGLGAALVAAAAQWGRSETGFFEMVYLDNFALFSKMLFMVAAGVVTATSIGYFENDGIRKGEFYPLLLFATVGMGLMAASADLIIVFLGIEVLSIATYVLAGYRHNEMKSTESALKYFILGAFSTAFLLYGIALVFGATGSTQYATIARNLAGAETLPPMAYIGLGLMIVGFGFKIAFVPFHVWTPDVYEGAPLPVMAHLAVASKAAALIAFLRLLYQVAPGMVGQWQDLLWIAAALTMMFGNLAALLQENIKRMLAYSSIAHAGYLLVGLAAHNEKGAQGILFYLVAYALMNLGALTVVQLVARRNEKAVAIKDYSGLGFQFPYLGLALSVFLVSLAGIPLTGGFTGKLFLFSAAIESGLIWLVVIAVTASAIGVYYYIRVLVFMYMRSPEGAPESVGYSLPARIVLVCMVLGTLYLGILPGSVLDFAREAISF